MVAMTPDDGSVACAHTLGKAETKYSKNDTQIVEVTFNRITRVLSGLTLPPERNH